MTSSIEQKMQNYAEDYAAGVATTLIGKLGQLLVEEYKLLFGIRGEVVLLRDDTAMIKALLRMLSETDDGAVDHFVREWMKQVRELSYDAEDCIDLFVHRISWAPILLDGDYLRRAWHPMVRLYWRHCLGSDIKALRARAIAISERHARYGLYGQALQPSVAFGSRIPTSSTPPILGIASNPSQYVARNNDWEIRSQVDGDPNSEDMKLKLLPLVGPAGVGKTALALAVCRGLKERFPCQAIVSVSQQFDASKDLDRLLWRILEQVNVKEDNSEEYAALGVDGKLKKQLEGNRYLIVMDDVWSISAVNAINAVLPENNLRSRVIVTTRIRAVAKQCGQNNDCGVYIHEVVPLNQNDSEALFLNRVFGQQVPAAGETSSSAPTSNSSSVPQDRCPKGLQDEMDIIIQKCGGLPLVIVSIASILASYSSPRSLDVWKRICNSIGSQLETNSTLEGMMQIIALSYNHLPHHLKTCTMLLSSFPEDYMIPKDRLLRRWISEGLIPEKRGLTLQEVAEAYYDELLSRNVIQPGLAIDGTVKHCHVQNIMSEVIVSKSMEANFVSLVGSPRGGTSSYDPVRRLCVHGDFGHVAEGRGMEHIRSLTSFGGNINNGLGKLLDQLDKFTLLRVLDLEDYKHLNSHHHLRQVCRLFLLRFLNLNETNIEVLPSEISNLHQLQTLWLYETLLREVPGSVNQLKKLEDMSFSNREHPNIYLKLPQGLGEMEALQVLDRLELGKNDTILAKDIGRLVQLRKLGIVFRKDCNESVLTELAGSIDRISSLREFCIEEVLAISSEVVPAVSTGLQAVPAGENPGQEEAQQGEEGVGSNMAFLHQLKCPPLLLQYLLIDGEIDKFPEWVNSLTSLVHIELRSINLQSSQIYDVLCVLPSLVKITLGGGSCSEVQLVAKSHHKFPVLKELTIIEYEDTQKDVNFQEGAMEKLGKLTISFNSVKSLLGINNLTSLKEVELRGKQSQETLVNAVKYLNGQKKELNESDRFKVIVKYES